MRFCQTILLVVGSIAVSVPARGTPARTEETDAFVERLEPLRLVVPLLTPQRESGIDDRAGDVDQMRLGADTSSAPTRVRRASRAPSQPARSSTRRRCSCSASPPARCRARDRSARTNRRRGNGWVARRLHPRLLRNRHVPRSRRAACQSSDRARTGSRSCRCASGSCASDP